MYCRIFILLFLTALTGVYFGCVPSEPFQQEVIVVKIPPFYDPGLTSGQNHWLWREFLVPNDVAGRREKNGTIPDIGMPNDDSVITVKLSDDGRLTIDSENYGDISNTEPVKRKLKEVFEARAKNWAVESEERVNKAVGIRLPLSGKYGDLITVARAVKESGAEPIVLLLDGHLPEMIVISPGRLP